MRLLDPAPVIGGGRPPVIGERDGEPPAGAFDHRIGAVLDRELRLEAGRDAPGEEAVAWPRAATPTSAAKPSAGGSLIQSRSSALRVRLDQPVGRRAGEVVQRAAGRRLDRAQIERVRVIAEAVEYFDAQRIERQIERDPEIPREMRAGDLQPVRLEIVDQHLAEAAFLAQRLLGAGRNMAGLGSSSLDVARPERVILAVFSSRRHRRQRPGHGRRCVR